MIRLSSPVRIVRALPVFLALALLLRAPDLPALQPSLDITQYAHNAWSTRDGFLKGAVRAIVQTSDGYLWLGTEFGLVRFDGVRFVAWAPPLGQHLPSTNIRSLLAARDGTLWIGTLEGLASWKDGNLKTYSELAQQNVLALLEDREGRVWAGSFGVPKAKLCAIQRENTECHGGDGSFGQWVWSLYEDSEGSLWAGAETGLWRWKPGPPKRYPLPYPIDTAQAIAQGDHRALLLALGEGIWQFTHDNIKQYQVATPSGRITLVDMFRDHDGGMWVGTLNRGLLHVYQGRTSVFAQSDGLSGNHIQCLFEDREGNVWVGTTDGLDRFRETAAYSISVKQGLSSPSVESVLVARDNTVWLGTLDGLNHWNAGYDTIYWHGGKAAQPSETTEQPASVFYPAGMKPAVTELAGLPDNRPGSLYEDDGGRIWVSTPKGIARFENGRFSIVKEVPPGWVNAIVGDNKGGIWISYQDLGLVHWTEGKVVERVPWSRLGGNVIASSLAPDPVRGGLWLGFFEGGLVHFKDGQVRASFGRKEGLGRGRVMGLQVDGDGTLWAATEGGLSHWKDGQIVTLTSRNGLPCDAVHWSVEVDSFFWLYTPCGLLRIARSEFERWMTASTQTVQFTVFDRSDGVRSRALLAGYTPRVSRSADGRIWFSDLESVSVIDPRHLVFNKVGPPVHIEQIIADGTTYNAGGGLRLPARVRDLTIGYTALSFAAPEKVRFRYKLEGQDPDWREVINDRKVQYSNLAPRSYRFRVTACNESGVWNEEGATLDFVVPPAWYQTNWFAAACVAIIVAMLWMLYQLRLRQVARQFNRTLDARVSERTRIARDLHDTLLQSFHGLLLRFHTVSRLLPGRPAEAKEKLDSAIEQAEEAILEGRDAVQGLRISTVQNNDLALAISTMGEELAVHSTHPRVPKFRVEVQGETQELHPILRDEIYRIAVEALRNAFRHSQAQQIEVEIHYGDQQFRLRVRDDGRGFDPKVPASQPEGHYGLRGMRERAKIAGGKLKVWSEVGAGTEVELEILAGAVYANGLRRSWLSEKLTGKQ